MRSSVMLLAGLAMGQGCYISDEKLDRTLDPDQDGWDWPIDCDGSDPSINPDAEEVVYDGVDNDCNPRTLEDDLDEDGFVLEDDCDDADAEVNPDRAEVPYDGVDNDCSEQTPDDDLDGDGYGHEDDCNDEEASVNPGMAEIPDNGVDEDCNPSTLDTDVDEDGFDASLDCDDNDSSIYPGAPDVWYDGVDQDCAGNDDYDADGDGWTTDDVQNLEGEFGEDCDDANAVRYPGAEEVCGDGVANDCSLSIEESQLQCRTDAQSDLADLTDVIYAAELTNATGYYYAASAAGDVNDDGVPDIVLGSKSGGLHFFFGGWGGAASMADADLVVSGPGMVGGGCLITVAGGADIDGDGEEDFILGSPCERSQDGEVYLYYGPAMGLVDSSDAYNTFVGVGGSYGAEAGAVLSRSMSMNADGDDGYWVVVPQDRSTGSVQGTAYLLSGAIEAEATMTEAASSIVSIQGSLSDLDGDGDLNGDGIDDLVAGSVTDDGEVLFFWGPLMGQLEGSDADHVLSGGSRDDSFGSSVSMGGDVDGDGVSDVLVGDSEARGETYASGVVYLFTSLQVRDLSSDDATAVLLGEGQDAGAGEEVMVKTDLDADGHADLFSSAPYLDRNSNDRAGKIYLFFGPVEGELALQDADAFWRGEDLYEYAGNMISPIGDFNGDGFDDIVFGANSQEESPRTYGATYFVFGGGL